MGRDGHRARLLSSSPRSRTPPGPAAPAHGGAPPPLCAKNLTNPALLQGLLARTPMGRLAEPEDVAGVATFLCSPAAAYVTGQTLAVDGGYSVMGYW